MYFKEIAKVLGNYLFFFCVLLLVPLSLAGYDEWIHPETHLQPFSTKAFIWTFLLTFFLALLLFLLGRRGSGRMYRREGILAVVLIWLLSPLLGAMPFYFSGTLDNPAQALFEGVSGFTTTGATVMEAKQFDPITKQEVPIETLYLGIEDVNYRYFGTISPVIDPATGHILYEGVEAVSRALLFWRSLMQWIGGGGIMILLVAILPALGVGGKVMMQSEVTGPMKDSLTPRIKETAVGLWKIYIFLTFLEIALLLFTNEKMTLFDAVTVSLSTLSTGGFTTHNNSIGYFASASTDWIVIAFMLFGSVNFSIYFFCFKGKFFKLNDKELILFISIVLAISLFSALQIWGEEWVSLDGRIESIMTWPEALRAGTFQLVSAMTSTGFSIVNYEVWPYVVQALMLIVMFLGGMSGSTAGGMKIIRHLLLFRVAQTKVESLFRPETVRSIKVGGREVDVQTMVNVLVYFFLVIALSVLGTFLFALDGIDLETSISLMSSLINNTGISFRQAGVMHSFAFLSDIACFLSCFWMLLGRLEFFAVLVLLIPAFWQEDI